MGHAAEKNSAEHVAAHAVFHDDELKPRNAAADFQVKPDVPRPLPLFATIVEIILVTTYLQRAKAVAK